MLADITQELRLTGIELDPILSSLEYRKGVYHAAISLKTVPEDDASRKLMCSATHLAITGLYPDVGFDIKVHVPPLSPFSYSASTCKNIPPSETMSEWLKGQHKKSVGFTLLSCKTLLNASFHTIVTSLPWRNARNMQDRFNQVSNNTMQRLVLGDTNALFPSNYCDLFLPDPNEFMTFDMEVVHGNVRNVIGRDPLSLLEFYEVVYAICRSVGVVEVHSSTHLVYLRTFYPPDPYVSLLISLDLSCPLTTYVNNQTGSGDYVVDLNQTLCRMTHDYLVRDYPWHDSEFMKTRMQLLVHRLRWLADNGNVTVVTPLALVEYILPELKTLVTTAEFECIFKEVVHFLKREPEHILEVYESVYHMVANGKRSTLVRMLYDKLFSS